MISVSLEGTMSKTTEQFRAEYAAIRARSEAPTASDFDRAVRLYFTDNNLPENPPPALWVKVAAVVRFRCGRCAGTGAFITYVENGQPRGPGGICFRCEGKGMQDDGDVMRNLVHDRHYMSRAC